MPPTDPLRLADLTLAVAVRAGCDAVFIEPEPDNDAIYRIAFERGGTALTAFSVEGMVGAATIARLAYCAELDLSASHSSSAVIPVRSGDRTANVVITIRPGVSLRADLMVLVQQKVAPPAPAPAIAITPSSQVGNYRLLEMLGEGGMGTVYLAEHVVLGRKHALKVLLSRVFERHPESAEQFMREARAAARVRHPNIVDLFDFGHLSDGRPYFVMELLEGDSLAARVSAGALMPNEAVEIARQIAHALAAVHDHGVIHADVTPGNIIIAHEDPLQAKLVDFGLAAIVGESIVDEEADSVLGTPAYISPEQLRGLAPTDRSDQYGLGCVLYEMLSGEPPFHHENLRQLCMMHIGAPIPEVTSPYGPLPPKLVDLVTTCLQKPPQSRFPGMRAMIAALDEIERQTERQGWRKWLTS